MRAQTVFGKTLADAASPKLLVAYTLPFLTITGFLALALGENEFTEGAVALATQETELFSSFLVITFVLAAGIPFLALTAVLAATTLGNETETGALRILLSKPVRRSEVFVGTFVAVVAYSGLVALASLLVSGILLVEFSGVSTAAISEGIVAAMPGNVAFALFGACVVTALGLMLAVVTQDKLRTALGALTVPTLYFAFLPVRLFSVSFYEDYFFYLFDVNYHFGNAFVFFHETFGGDLPVEAQAVLSPWTGVYDIPSGEMEELPASLDTVGHVPMEASVVLLALLAVGSLALGIYRFERMDV